MRRARCLLTKDALRRSEQVTGSEFEAVCPLSVAVVNELQPEFDYAAQSDNCNYPSICW